MIYKEVFEQCFNRLYNEVAANSIIVFGSEVLEEDVKVTMKNKKGFEIGIRTKENGGRSGKNIIHGAALKFYINNKYTDLYVKKQDDGKYKCEIDRKEKEKKSISRSNEYKVAKKFIEKNGELLAKIYDSKEESDTWNEYIQELKELNPEFKYSK